MKNSSIIMLVFLVSSCNGFEPEIETASADASTYKWTEVNPQQEERSLDADRKLIKTARVEITISNADSCRLSLINVVKAQGGYVFTESQYTASYTVGQSLEFKVPVDRFDHVIDYMKSNDQVLDRLEISTKDVTDQFIDLGARIKAKSELERRFLLILSKANSVEEILQVEHELSTVRTAIESMQAKSNSLTARTRFSTVFVTLHQPIVRPDDLLDSGWVQSLHQGWGLVTSGCLGLLKIWPILILLWLVIWWAKRRVKSVRTVSATANPTD